LNNVIIIKTKDMLPQTSVV